MYVLKMSMNMPIKSTEMFENCCKLIYAYSRKDYKTY